MNHLIDLIPFSCNLFLHQSDLIFVGSKNVTQGRSKDFSKGGSQQGHHPGIADYIWFIALLSLVYQRAQLYYRGMKAHINKSR